MKFNKSKALHLIQKAEKKSEGGGGLFRMCIGGSKSEEACELYVKAANSFKRDKNWDEAGNAFVKSAEINLNKGDAEHDAVLNYAEAAKCFRKSNPAAAVDCLLKTAEIYTDMGNYYMAAKHHKLIAELYETEFLDLEKAMANYEKAADYYKGEEYKSTANNCLLKVAQCAAQLEQYKRAVDCYEEVGMAAVDSSLLKYSAKDYFFKACLCYLCLDLLDAQHAVERYDGIHPPFSDSREHKLIKDCILALEEQNAESFTNSVKDYDKISRLDQWTTTMLLRIKKACGEAENLDLL